jgi:hypothetical protein
LDNQNAYYSTETVALTLSLEKCKGTPYTNPAESETGSIVKAFKNAIIKRKILKKIFPTG